jgi:signal transduction histidine kinase
MNRRLVLWGCGLALLALLAAGAALTHRTNRREREREEHVLALEAERIAKHLDATRPQIDNATLRLLNFQRLQIRILLYDLSGWEIGRPKGTHPALFLNETAPRLAWPELLRPLHGETPLPPLPRPETDALRARSSVRNRLFISNVIGSCWISEMTSRTGERWLVATTPVAAFDAVERRAFLSAWVQAVTSMEDLGRPASERWFMLGVAAVLSGAILGVVAWAASQQTRALNAAAAQAEAIPLDRLHLSRLPEPPDDPDARRLVRACNRLLEQVAAAHLAQQRFVADAAHELRTPLTILRGEVQVALREPHNHPFLLETLRSGLDETVHLSRLVDSLLTLARVDAGQVVVGSEAVVLAPLLRSTLARLEALAAPREVRLELEVGPGAEPAAVRGDDVALGRVVRNLVENALRHSPPGQTVRVDLTVTSERLHLTVTDRGVGIPPEHLPRLFQRFHRVDAARRRAEGGAGLGLAIVRALAEAMGGTVAVRSEVGEGSTFTVDLPRALPPH